MAKDETIKALQLDTLQDELYAVFRKHYHELADTPQAQAALEAVYNEVDANVQALIAMLLKAVEQRDFAIDEHKELQQEFRTLTKFVQRDAGEMALQSADHSLTTDDIKAVIGVLLEGHPRFANTDEETALDKLYKAMAQVANEVIASDWYESFKNAEEEGA